MNVYTYYMPVPGLWSDESQLKLIEVWKRSWSKAGWTPRVLTEDDAKKHPRYEEFKKKFWELPTEYGHDYEGACFMRWAAVANEGGGMMTDYDVINYGFPPVYPDPTRLSILADPSVPPFMGVALGPQNLFEGMCQLFYTWEPDDRDKHPDTGQRHCSDLSFLLQVFDKKNRECPEWLKNSNGCTVFPKITGALVHYGYPMKAAGHWPKWENIEAIRPF